MTATEITVSIKKAMLDTGINRRTLAKKVGREYSTITKRFKDIDSVSLGELSRMADVLGLEVKIVRRGE